MKIEIRHRTEINYRLWDSLVLYSPKASIFHFAWFLELLEEDWYALVGDDYRWVLPFFSKNKQVYMPSLLPYLGLISKDNLIYEEFGEILNFWNSNMLGIHYTFSKYHFKFKKVPDLQVTPFYQKDLLNRYENVSKTFNKSLMPILESTEEKKLNVMTLRSILEFTSYLELYGDWTPEELFTIRKIVSRSVHLKTGKMYAIYDRMNQLHAVSFILLFRTKAYVMFTAFDTEKTRDLADYKLMNTIIEELSLYNISIENHSPAFDETLLKQFGFNVYHSFNYQYYAKQNILSLLLKSLQYLKP